MYRTQHEKGRITDTLELWLNSSTDDLAHHTRASELPPHTATHKAVMSHARMSETFSALMDTTRECAVAQHHSAHARTHPDASDYKQRDTKYVSCTFAHPRASVCVRQCR